MSLKIKGINYDVGTEYIAGRVSRRVWIESDVVRDMKAIRRDLYCNSVNLYGSDIPRLVEGAGIALKEGLTVSLQPRLIEGNRQQMLVFLERCAREAERLRQYGEITLNTGCELTLFTRGFMPGRVFLSRIKNLLWTWPLLPLFNYRLNQHLREVVQMTRASFGGPITYGAGVWERVDWRGFDMVGVNLYRDKENEATYTANVRQLHEHGKPVLITEFGCCTFQGAERVGGGGWLIVDYNHEPPTVKPGYIRSEQVQADLIDELLAVFSAEAVYGAYIFDFMQSSHRYDPNPERDLDMASYGVVKVMPQLPGETSIQWERKRAFELIATRFKGE